ncbi:MAG: HEPN domain-containing protein [Thermomicrobiales bacterium]
MAEREDALLRKAAECLLGAESEYTNRRFNNSANRCYYACYQAAVVAISRAGIRPGKDGAWSHRAIQAQFGGHLVYRRKLYPSDLRDTLSQLMVLRQTADYRTDDVSEIQAARALRRAKALVEVVRRQGVERP